MKRPKSLAPRARHIRTPRSLERALLLEQHDTIQTPAARAEPIEAQVELLKETGRLLFLRGLVVQGEARIAAFSATIRKPSKA